MKKWEYAHVVYQRKHNPGEFCIYGHETVMSDVDPISGLHVDRFLGAAGQRGWELTGTLLPFPPGKKLWNQSESGEDVSFVVTDPLDIQWLIFKREI